MEVDRGAEQDRGYESLPLPLRGRTTARRRRRVRDQGEAHTIRRKSNSSSKRFRRKICLGGKRTRSFRTSSRRTGPTLRKPATRMLRDYQAGHLTVKLLGFP